MPLFRLRSFKFCCIYEFNFCLSVYGRLLTCDKCCVMFHSFCSNESGSKCMHVMKYLYAALLCTVGWFEEKLVVLSG